MQNKVYPFIITSHTLIWAQPNDCGLNLCFHRCIEFICKRRRHVQGGKPDVAYFNEIFSDAWRHYMNQEQHDLLSEKGSNNTTSAYEKTGLYPFNPRCWAWTEAIESNGKSLTVLRDCRRKVQYNIAPNGQTNHIVLSPDNKSALRNGMDISKDLFLVK
jgi:hypothetical protein